MKLKISIKPIILALVTGSCLTTSCTDLIDDSYTNVPSDVFKPESDTDISALVSAVYIPWRKTMLLFNGIVRSQELNADEDVMPARTGIGWDDGGIYKREHHHEWTAQDDEVVQGWERTFSGINTCNQILWQIESGAITVPDEVKKKGMIAELKVLRASYYYILVDLYGNVPIVTDFKDTALPKQSTRKEVYDFIVKEISDNINDLSTDARGEYYGRMNQWVAHTLLAKMYLNAEVWTGTAEWQKCIDECDAVIKHADETGDYILEKNQKDVFVTNNENSKEIIYGLPIDPLYVTDWNGFDFHLYTLAPENQETYKFIDRPWGGVCAVPQFIDSFDPDDSRLTENYIYGPQKDYDGNPLKRADGNMKIADGYLDYVNRVASIDSSDVAQGYRWGKYEYAIKSDNVLANDFVVFRYADILMMKAECLLRLGEPGAGALVTEVRRRAFQKAPSKAEVTDEQLKGGSVYDYGRRDNKATTHEGGADIKYGRMLDELGWEFNQEGRRRQDMIRFGIFTTKSWFSHDKTDKNKELFPIPTSALQTNSNLKQNPGY